MKAGDVLTGRFRIEAEAGSGAMGVVYRAADLVEGGVVAVKVLRGAGRAAARFGRETRVLARLTHPAIVRYVAHGATPEGAPYLAMQWLEGEDLGARLLRGPLAIGDALALTRRVADALALIHTRGVVHRDLKPSNLFLVGRDPRSVVMLDFGIARTVDATVVVTAAGAIIGTPGYMAPEQARGEATIDARADVFALGCVLFECLTGKRVFDGEHIMAVLVKILLEEPPRVSELGAVPSVLDELVSRMLSKNPRGRPADAAAVRRSVEEIESGLGDAAAGAVVVGAESAAKGPPSLSRGEQQIVSVVMAATPAAPPVGRTASLAMPEGGADLHGSADTFPGTDDTEDALPTVGAAVKALGRFGARVEHLPDGLVVATLSGVAAATDQAAQAARCALALRGSFATAPIVVATGRALVEGRLPVGPVIDRAVSMLRTLQTTVAFGPPATLLDDTTAGLLPSRFRVSTTDRGTMLAGEEHAADSPRTLLGKATPFVGRDQEVGTLVGLYHHVESDQVGRAAVVTGAAGLGKSRLRDEVLRRLRAPSEAPQIWLTAGDQLAARAPLATLARALRSAFGVADGEPVERRRGRILERVRRRMRAPDSDRAAAFLGELVGAPFERTDDQELVAARQEPALMADQTQRALLDFLDAELAVTPLVIVVEDAHWADPSTMKLLGILLRELRERPLFVLAFGRPEIDDAFPSLWSERDALRLALPVLPSRAAARLASGVLGRPANDPTVRRIVEQAGGNPFFLEELLRGAAGGDASSLPETVLAMVQKRLESLADELRRVLRAASVFGPAFCRGGASALLGDPNAHTIESWLSELVEREVLIRRPEAQIRGEVEYGFGHALVRDCAYRMLTDTDRTLAHKLAGEWLEAAGEHNAAVLGEHFERGGERLRAVDKYAQAATQALEADDLASAVRVVAHALGLEPQAEQRGLLQMLRAEAYRWRGELESARADGLEAVDRLPPESGTWYKAMAGAIASCASTGHVEEATTLADRLRGAGAGEPAQYLTAVAQSATYLLSAGKHDTGAALLEVLRERSGEDGPALLSARCALAEAMHAHVTGNMPRSHREMLRAAEHFESAGDRRSACAARANAGLIDSLMGRLERAETLLAEALVLAERGGVFNTVAWIKQNLALVVARTGRPTEGLTLAREAAAAAHEQQDFRLEAKARITEGEILLETGDAAAAEATARSGLVLAEGAVALRAGALAVLADALAAQGRLADAHAAAVEAGSFLERGEALEEAEAAVRLVLAESLFRVGSRPEGQAVLDEARRRLLEKADAIVDPNERRMFLSRVPVHARTLALAADSGRMGA